MTMYEIDSQVSSLIDPETGEILDFEAFEQLQMEKEQKLENMALWVKDLEATAAAIANEVKVLNERKKALEKKSESLQKYLSILLDGQKFSTPKCAISFRKSEQVEIDDDFLEWCKSDLEAGFDYLRIKEPEVDKTAVKAALKNGVVLEKARLVKNSNINIK